MQRQETRWLDTNVDTIDQDAVLVIYSKTKQKYIGLLATAALNRANDQQNNPKTPRMQ